MSIANENNRVDFTAVGGETSVAYNFKINAQDEVAVYRIPDGETPVDATHVLILATDYTVDGLGAAGGGNINFDGTVFPTGLTTDDTIVIVRAIDFDQPNSFVVGQDHAPTLEDSVDQMAMRIQRMAEAIDRCYKNDVSEGGAPDPVLDTFAMQSWSPNIYDASSAGNAATGNTSVGHYILIGDVVFFEARVTLSSNLGIPAGAVWVGELPYAPHADAVLRGQIYVDQTKTRVADYSWTGNLSAGNVRFRVKKTNLATGFTNALNTDFAAGAVELRVLGFYQKA